MAGREWGKATQTSSPVWYLHALELKVFSWTICCAPSDTGHSGDLGTHKHSRSEATALLPGRALLPNREQCRTRQRTRSTSPGVGPSCTAHLKSYPFLLARTPLHLLHPWQHYTRVAGLQAGGCPAQCHGTQGHEVILLANQRVLHISPVLSTYLHPSHNAYPASCISNLIAHHSRQVSRLMSSCEITREGGDQRH